MWQTSNQESGGVYESLISSRKAGNWRCYHGNGVRKIRRSGQQRAIVSLAVLVVDFVPCLLLAFLRLMLSAVAVNLRKWDLILPTDQLLYVDCAAICFRRAATGACLRCRYLADVAGQRSVPVSSSCLALVSFAVQDTSMPLFSTFIIISCCVVLPARTFASSMANISFFFQTKAGRRAGSGTAVWAIWA